MNAESNPPHTGDSDIVNAIASMREAGLHDLSICEALGLNPVYLATIRPARSGMSTTATDGTALAT